MPDRYAAERGMPIQACSAISHLTFNGTLFTFSVAGITHTYVAASGKRGPDFTLEAQEDHGLGTIPEGEYWVDPQQMWSAGLTLRLLSETPASWYTDGWGFNRLTIHPFPNTETYGRGGFFIHGGTHQGSAGCVHLLGQGMDRFLADLKKALGGLPGCSIRLTVKYPH